MLANVLDLATRPRLTQRYCTALIETYDAKRVLADISADDGNRAVETLRHSVLLVVVRLLLVSGALARFQAGWKRGRPNPLGDIVVSIDTFPTVP